MSIETEVSSMIENIKKDYEELENIGAELENVDKNIENIASVVNGIYDNLPKTTGEDTSLSLTTLKGKMNIQVKGDTEQTQYSGYNILNPNTASGTSGVLTTTYLGNTRYRVQGLATGNKVFFASMGIASGTYTLSITLVSGSYSGGNLVIQDTSNTTIGEVGIGALNTKVTKTVTGTIGRLILWNTQTFDAQFDIQIESGTTAHDYEPFVGGTASPNPTFPQDIEVVTGTQEVKVENVNLLPTPYVYDSRTINGITFTINNDYSISASGTATGNATFVLLNETSSKLEDIRKLLLNNSCTLSGCPTGGSSSSYRLQLYGRGSAGTGTSVDYGSGVAITNFENTSNNFNIAIFIPSGTTISTPIIFKPQLEKRKCSYFICTTPRTNTNSRII